MLPVDWKEMFTAADSKAAGLSAPLIAEKIEEFNLKTFDKVKWVKRPSDEIFKADMEKVISDILRINPFDSPG
jgi:hypothetical protein